MSVPFELVIFDLGGTVLVDRGDMPAAFRNALKDVGVPFDEAEMSGWRGASKPQIIRELIHRSGPHGAASTDLEARVYRRFQTELAERLSSALPVEGFPEAFEALRRKGIRLAVNTGYDRFMVEQVWKATGWAPELFDAVVCSEDVPVGRPAPFMIFRAMELSGSHSVHRVAAVGDTLLDLQAAWNAGAGLRAGVLTGAHDRSRLESGPYTHILQSAAELAEIL